MTGAVTAVTWGRDPALDVTGTVPAVIAVAGCHSPSRRADGPGHVLLTTLGSLAHATLACATEVATALRDTRRYARPSRYPLNRCQSRRWSRTARVAGHVPRATPRSRLRSKMSQGRNGPAAGQGLPRRHRRQDRALAAARRLVNKSSDRLHRAFPLRARLVGRCSKPPVAEARAWVGIGLGRTRRRGGGRSSGARARLAVKAAGGR